MERDPKYLRRWLIGGATFYVFGVLLGIIEIARGEKPIQALIGLPIPLLMIWIFVRTILSAAIGMRPPKILAKSLGMRSHT